jgi:NAD(P)-dependent dehydrogenase (short-subunit alcohol dehydrogenase family)
VKDAALAGQVAIVTGGTSGIGQSTAVLLAEHGATLAVFGRNRERGRAVLDELDRKGATARFVEIDMGDAEAIKPAVDDTVAELGRVDILVNNAAVRGIGRRKGIGGLFDIDATEWDYVQAANVRGPFLCIQAVGRHLIDQGTGGRIVNVSSTAASVARHTSMDYAASKAALESLTRTAAAQLGAYGVNVNAVAPGLTRTPYRPGSDEDLTRIVSQGPMENLMHRFAESEEVAAVIVFLCLPASRQMTGQTIHTSAGMIV